MDFFNQESDNDFSGDEGMPQQMFNRPQVQRGGRRGGPLPNNYDDDDFDDDFDDEMDDDMASGDGYDDQMDDGMTDDGYNDGLLGDQMGSRAGRGYSNQMVNFDNQMEDYPPLNDSFDDENQFQSVAALTAASGGRGSMGRGARDVSKRGPRGKPPQENAVVGRQRGQRDGQRHEGQMVNQQNIPANAATGRTNVQRGPLNDSNMHQAQTRGQPQPPAAAAPADPPVDRLMMLQKGLRQMIEENKQLQREDKELAAQIAKLEKENPVLQHEVGELKLSRAALDAELDEIRAAKELKTKYAEIDAAAESFDKAYLEMEKYLQILIDTRAVAKTVITERDSRLSTIENEQEELMKKYNERLENIRAKIAEISNS